MRVVAIVSSILAPPLSVVNQETLIATRHLNLDPHLRSLAAILDYNIRADEMIQANAEFQSWRSRCSVPNVDTR